MFFSLVFERQQNSLSSDVVHGKLIYKSLVFTDFFGARNLTTSEIFWSESAEHREAEALHRGRGDLHWQVSDSCV